MQQRFSVPTVVGVLSALILTGTPNLSRAENPHSIQNRLENQEERINEGIEQGQIGQHEKKALKTQQRSIKRTRHRMRHDDGILGPKERARLQHRLNKSSRTIHRAVITNPSFPRKFPLPDGREPVLSLSKELG